jgi:hypothetical protein
MFDELEPGLNLGARSREQDSCQSSQDIQLILRFLPLYWAALFTWTPPRLL